MPQKQRVRELEINEDLDFQRRNWRAERAGWVAMLLIVVAALFGLFGRGPLSDTVAQDGASGLRVAYDRFTRRHSHTELHVRLPGATAADTLTRLWVSRPFFETIEVTSVAPEPQQTEVGPERVTLVFRREDPARETSITLKYQPEALWERSGRLGLTSGPGIGFSQFVYP